MTKTQRRPCKERTYTMADVHGALDAVKQGISVVQASRLYAIPRSTLLGMIDDIYTCVCIL